MARQSGWQRVAVLVVRGAEWGASVARLALEGNRLDLGHGARTTAVRLLGCGKEEEGCMCGKSELEARGRGDWVLLALERLVHASTTHQ